MRDNDCIKLARFYRKRDNRVMRFRFPEGVEIFYLLCNTLASSGTVILSHPVCSAVFITGIKLIWALILTLTSI
jgi:hypothetical protein